MQYVNFVYGDGEEGVPYTAPVPEGDAEYLRRTASTLRPLSEQDYSSGPLVILHTIAKFSYVLDGADVYWCAEWEPGLIIVRFSPDGTLQWTALRSLVPNFGGREASEAELDAYDEDADNPQYNLIFDPWDAQFDADEREWKSFVPAPDDVIARFNAATARANELGKANPKQTGADSTTWSDQCIKNLEAWTGDRTAMDLIGPTVQRVEIVQGFNEVSE